jgi:hypothetical protein
MEICNYKVGVVNIYVQSRVALESIQSKKY